MIRNLSDKELEQASGGFDISDLIPNLNERPVARISLETLTQVTTPPTGVVLTDTPHIEAAPTTTPEIKNLSLPICRDRRGRYAICQEDGVHERWERYRPQQPSFRSRFINR